MSDELARLRAQIAAMPSAIEAYADSELDSISYVLSDPELSEEDRRILLAEREALHRLQRHARNIIAYAATAEPAP